MPPRERKTKWKVHTSWMRLFPKRGHDMRFWLEVSKRVKAKGVRSTNLKEIKSIIKETEYEFILHRR